MIIYGMNMSEDTRTQVLDITQEKRELIRLVQKKEQELQTVLEKVESLKRLIAEFQELYDIKIRKLYLRLEYLEEQVLKYRNIREVVDNLFSFAEAEEVYEETMKSRRARMAEDYERGHSREESVQKRNALSESVQHELKVLYRKLARLFHPDRLAGDDTFMIQINNAYAQADVEFLRNFQLHHAPADKQDYSLHGLQQRLQDVYRLIENANTEIQLLRKHDMYIMKQHVAKTKLSKEIFFQNQAKKIRRKIMQKQEELDDLKEKVGGSGDNI